MEEGGLDDREEGRVKQGEVKHRVDVGGMEQQVEEEGVEEVGAGYQQVASPQRGSLGRSQKGGEAECRGGEQGAHLIRRAEAREEGVYLGEEGADLEGGRICKGSILGVDVEGGQTLQGSIWGGWIWRGGGGQEEEGVDHGENHQRPPPKSHY